VPTWVGDYNGRCLVALSVHSDLEGVSVGTGETGKEQCCTASSDTANALDYLGNDEAYLLYAK
jgi:hypothetical protein